MVWTDQVVHCKNVCVRYDMEKWKKKEMILLLLLLLLSLDAFPSLSLIYTIQIWYLML
jgi:hypothetical protein